MTEEGKWYEKGLFQAPQLVRGTDVDNTEYNKEKGTSWSELFFDLIFVTAIANLGTEFKSHGFTLKDYVLYFMVMWRLWNSYLKYTNRFFIDDMSDKTFTSLYMAGVVILTSHIHGGVYGPNYAMFSTIFAIVLFILAFRYARVAYFLPEVSCYAFNHCLIQIFFALMFLTIPAGFILFPAWPEVLLFIYWLSEPVGTMFFVLLVRAGILDALTPYCSFFRKQNFFLPIHIEHFIDRIGGFMIIVMGESIDGISKVSENYSYHVVLIVLLSFYIVYNIKLLQFDTDVKLVEEHALRVHQLSGAAWGLCIPFLALGISMVGDALEVVLESVKEKGEPTRKDVEFGQFYLCYSMGLVYFVLVLLGYSHSPTHHKVEQLHLRRLLKILYYTQMFFQFLIAGACLLLSKFIIWDPYQLIIILCLFSIFLVSINLLDEFFESKCRSSRNVSTHELLQRQLSSGGGTPRENEELIGKDEDRIQQLVESIDVSQENIRIELLELLEKRRSRFTSSFNYSSI